MSVTAKKRGTMNRERALKVVLIVVGLLFSVLVYPLMMFVKQAPALAMMLSLYVTLGIFLLLAARNPSQHRSLITFTAWSSFAHGGLMAVQAFQKNNELLPPWPNWPIASKVSIAGRTSSKTSPLCDTRFRI